jgi:hypothetical protein
MIEDTKRDVAKRLLVDSNAENFTIEVGRSIKVGNGNIKPDGSILFAIEIAHITLLHRLCTVHTFI